MFTKFSVLKRRKKCSYTLVEKAGRRDYGNTLIEVSYSNKSSHSVCGLVY